MGPCGTISFMPSYDCSGAKGCQLDWVYYNPMGDPNVTTCQIDDESGNPIVIYGGFYSSTVQRGIAINYMCDTSSGFNYTVNGNEIVGSVYQYDFFAAGS